jgi:hypothetical protein
MFLRSGWSIVRSALLAKGGTSKKILSPHLHKVPTQSNKVKSTNFSNGPHKQHVLSVTTFEFVFIIQNPSVLFGG